MRFDVPVVGLPTIERMKSARATALALDAGRTLLFDREKLLAQADAAGIAIQVFPPASAAQGNELSTRQASIAEPRGASRGMNEK